jgi:hypothetical protein
VEDRVADKDELGEYRRQFNEAADNTTKERADAERNRDYVDGIQWTADEAAALAARGQPVLTDNKIKDKVEYMEGVEKKTRTDPKAYPRTQMHEKDADVATDCIRYVFDKNNVNQTKSRVFQNLLVEGMGGAEVVVEKDDPRKITVRYCRWDRLYVDPYSMEPDYSDAMYRGLITWMDISRAKARWPDAGTVFEETMKAPRPAGETHDDKPRWLDAKRNRVQVFEHYCWHGDKLMRSVFVWGGFLEQPAECPYVDDEGDHEDPLILQSAYIDREGRRYGLVSRYISLQDEVNKRKSKSLHLLNTAFLITEKGAVDDIAKARKEVHKPDGAVEVTPGMRFEIERNLDLSQAHFMLLQQAESALSTTGPNAALLGNSGSISGRAKELDQQGGVIQIGVLFDAIRFWQLRVARAVWNRIRQYWDQEMYIRVTDDETSIRFVPINQPMVQGDLMAEQLKNQQMAPEQKQAAIQQIAQDPRSQLPVMNEDGTPKVRNAVAQMDMDIIIDEAPDVITIQQEEFAKLAELAGTGNVPIPPDVLIEASQLRSQTKKRIMDKLSGENDPAAKQMAALQQQMQELAAALQAAQVRKVNAEAAKAEAATVESQVDASVKVAEFTSPQAAPAAKTQVSVN